MKFNFSGAKVFLSFLSGESSLYQVFEHPAYQIVRQHAQKYSRGLEPADISLALGEKPSPFYGLKDLTQNLPKIRKLLAKIQMSAADWVVTAQNNLQQRLTYRIGCDIVRKIETASGAAGVKTAFYMDSETFISEYGRMISI